MDWKLLQMPVLKYHLGVANCEYEAQLFRCSDVDQPSRTEFYSLEQSLFIEINSVVQTDYDQLNQSTGTSIK
jgi:hypothetical protein